MRHLRTGIGMLLATMLVLTTIATAGAAQLDGSSPGDLEGLERAISRAWTGDMMAMAASMGEGSDPSDIEFIIGVSANVLVFSSSDDAEAAFDDTVALIEQNVSASETEGFQFEDADLELNANQAVARTASADLEGLPATVLLAATQQDATIYVVMGISINVDTSGLVTGISNTLLEMDAGDGEESFKAEGGSTGGLWDIFPTAETHPAFFDGLENTNDGVLFPEVEASPTS